MFCFEIGACRELESSEVPKTHFDTRLGVSIDPIKKTPVFKIKYVIRLRVLHLGCKAVC